MTLVIGDIHGAFRALTQVLERTDFRPSSLFIFLGDYADGWSQTPEVLDFLIEFQKEHHCIFLRGNHDALCENFLRGLPSDGQWLSHGGKATIQAYENVSPERKAAHLRFLSSLKNYYLDSQNRLFLHAGFTNLRGVAYEHFEEMFYWDRTLWELAYATHLPPTHPHFPPRLALYPQIYIGHTPTTRLGTDQPLTFNGVTNVDTGAAFKGRISVLNIDTLQLWQSDPVHTLYPNEAGRNR